MLFYLGNRHRAPVSPQPLTDAADTMVVMLIQIVSGQSVTTLTVALSSLIRRGAVTAKDIDRFSNDLKVIRSDTPPVAAKMI